LFSAGCYLIKKREGGEKGDWRLRASKAGIAEIGSPSWIVDLEEDHGFSV